MSPSTLDLPNHWALPAAIRQRFGQRSAGKQRAMLADGHLLLVLHRAPQPGERSRRGAFFWRQPDGTWTGCDGRSQSNTPDALLRDYSRAGRQLGDRYHRAIEAEDYFRLLEAMLPLRLSARNLYATLQAAREGMPSAREIIDWRDEAYALDRELDLQYETVKTALEFHVARRAEQQAQLGLESVKATQRLNTLAAIFYPLTAISCAFGMNLSSGLEGGPIVLFWGLVAATLGLGWWVRQWMAAGKFDALPGRPVSPRATAE